MFVFNNDSARRVYTPWGKEVIKRLIDRDMRQSDLLTKLQTEGFNINKHHLSNLMYGVGTSARTGEIKEINRILEIE
ncbi:MAG TPA: hypothetical protein DD733_07545 [Clostridiales bacterium]|nr:hypothetical protein [Clostridiales bacterium]